LIDDIDPNIVIKKLLNKYNNKMIEKAYKYALEQSWENRTMEWLNLIEDEE